MSAFGRIRFKFCMNIPAGQLLYWHDISDRCHWHPDQSGISGWIKRSLDPRRTLIRHWHQNKRGLQQPQDPVGFHYQFQYRDSHAICSAYWSGIWLFRCSLGNFAWKQVVFIRYNWTDSTERWASNYNMHNLYNIQHRLSNSRSH